jgi:transcriptional antiterminator RfaH
MAIAKYLPTQGVKTRTSPGLMPAMDSPVTRLRWYVVQCKTREDHRALEHLERQGFCCYRPTLRIEKVQRGRKVEVRESLFPGYLFVQLDQVNHNWSPIRSTRGVIQVVRFNEHPLPVEDEVIELIRERLASGGPRVPYLKSGERVLVTDGCFADVEAIFVANDGERRVMLLMSILHREQTVSFPVDSVRKVRDRGAA